MVSKPVTCSALTQEDCDSSGDLMVWVYAGKVVSQSSQSILTLLLREAKDAARGGVSDGHGASRIEPCGVFALARDLHRGSCLISARSNKRRIVEARAGDQARACFQPSCAHGRSLKLTPCTHLSGLYDPFQQPKGVALWCLKWSSRRRFVS